MAQPKGMRELVCRSTQVGRCDAAVRRALEPGERHVLDHRIGAEFRSDRAVVGAIVDQVRGPHRREAIAAQQGDAGPIPRPVTKTAGEPAGNATVRAHHLPLVEFEPDLAGLPDGEVGVNPSLGHAHHGSPR